MANQLDPGTMGGTAAESASRQDAVASQGAAAAASGAVGHGEVPASQAVAPSQTPYPPYHGRRVSWVAIGIVIAGFLMGGLALVFGPAWPVFWAGLGVAVLGLLVSLFTNTFEDWY
jgi:MFS family permease